MSTIDRFIADIFEQRANTIRKAKPIVDKNVVDVLTGVNLFNSSSDNPLVFDQAEFKKTYHDWILSSKLFKIHGLDSFEHRYITNGVTEAFNDFYYLNKKIYVLHGEYNYHDDLGITVLQDIKHIPSYSALIVSYPFSASGNVHKDWNSIIETCEERAIKVFIDCCFFGIAAVQDLDLSSESITHVAFSLSKSFSTGGIRTGILYSRHNNNTPLRVQDRHWYTQMAGQSFHSELMQNFDPDYIYNKYRETQLEVCKDFDITPSDTVIFGISDSKEHKYFDRGGYTNRMCISYALQEFKNDLTSETKNANRPET